MTNEYEQQAQSFLEKTGTTFKAEFIKNDKYFDDDKETRDIYQITLKRGERVYSFKFGQSVNNSVKYLVFFPSGRRKYNDLKQARKEYLREVKGNLSRGEYRENENFKEPTPYDVLASVQKNEVGTFENFCADFGYDTDSIKTQKIYLAVLEEYKNICMLFSEQEMNELCEIQ